MLKTTDYAMRGKRVDQAESLRELVRKRNETKFGNQSEIEKKNRMKKNYDRVRTIAITSGKGGVGKTNLPQIWVYVG